MNGVRGGSDRGGYHVERGLIVALDVVLGTSIFWIVFILETQNSQRIGT